MTDKMFSVEAADHLASKFRKSGPNSDPADADEIDNVPPEDILGGLFHIGYTDSKGDISERPIHVYAITQRGENICVTAHCYLRDRVRSFRTDRIEFVAHGRTGEIICEDGSIFERLARPARESNERQPRNNGFPLLRDRTRPTAIILMAMARADANLCQNEISVIRSLISDRNADLVASQSEADDLLVELTALAPTKHLITRAMRSVMEDADRADLPSWVRRMAEADGKICGKEIETYRGVIASLRRVVDA